MGGGAVSVTVAGVTVSVLVVAVVSVAEEAVAAVGVTVTSKDAMASALVEPCTISGALVVADDSVNPEAAGVVVVGDSVVEVVEEDWRVVTNGGGQSLAPSLHFPLLLPIPEGGAIPTMAGIAVASEGAIVVVGVVVVVVVVVDGVGEVAGVGGIEEEDSAAAGVSEAGCIPADVSALSCAAPPSPPPIPRSLARSDSINRSILVIVP